MIPLIYDTGTVTVEHGSAEVTGNLTGWQVALVAGGLFSCVGISIPIASVESDTALTLAYPWPGSDVSGKAYAIARDTSEAVRAAWTNDRLATIIQRLSLVGIHPDGSGTLAERDALDPVPAAGYWWLYAEPGHDLVFYRKTASGWEGPFEVRGSAGGKGDQGVPGLGSGGYGLPPGGSVGQALVKSENDDGVVEWSEGLVVDSETGALAIRELRSIPANRARASSILFTPGGDGTVSIYRLDTASGQNPRTATVASVSGTRITLSTAAADTLFGSRMTGVVCARIWNTTLSPASHSAWVNAYVNASQLEVTDAADIAAWSAGDTVQIGDPTSVTPGRCITLDISPMLVNLFGQSFRQTGIIVKGNLIDGAAPKDSISITPGGVTGSFVAVAVNNVGDGVTLVPCTDLSPISNSNLVRIRETISTTANTRLVSSIAVLG